MEPCPACQAESIPSWRRWLSRKKFQCKRCGTWLWLCARRGEPVGRANVRLFIAYPLLIVGAALGLPLALASVPLEHRMLVFWVTLGPSGVLVLAWSVRTIGRSRFVVCDVQRRSGELQDLRAAWRIPEFRVGVGKLVLFLVETMLLLVMGVYALRFLKNAL